MKVKDRFLDDLDWAGEHHSELLKQYRNEWIAIYNKKIVAHGRALEQVEKEAERRTGVPEKEIPVYFVDSGSNIYAS